MKRCPRCDARYPDALGFCTEDATPLEATGSASLEDVLARGPLSVPEALTLARAVGGCLADYARSGQRLFALHPSDLEGEALDPARPLRLIAPREPSTPGSTRWEAAAPYAAPEVLRRGAVTEKAWVYALGVVLYEALAGHRPFTAATAAALAVRQILEAPPPLAALRPELPAALVELVDRARARLPEARPDSLAACLRALDALEPIGSARPRAAAMAPAMASAMPSAMAPQTAYAATQPAAHAPAQAPRGRSRALVGGGLLLTLVVAAMALMLSPRRSLGPADTASAPAPQGAPESTARAPAESTPAAPAPTAPETPAAAPSPPPLPGGAPPEQAAFDRRGGLSQARARRPAPSVGWGAHGRPMPSEPPPQPPPQTRSPQTGAVERGAPAAEPAPLPPPTMAPDSTPRDAWALPLAALGLGWLGLAAAVLVWARRRSRGRTRPAVPPGQEPASPRMDSGAYDRTVEAHTGPAATAPATIVHDPTISSPRTLPNAGRDSVAPMDAFTLGTYHCLERLGEGGMGVVYRARHTSLGRACAVKVLLPGRVLDAEAMALFHREAQLAAQINHPHSVTIYDFGAAEGLLYLAMELIEGPSLAALVDRGPLELARVVDLATQVCDALDAAHALGIVHSDLKPANLMVTQRRGRDFVKIVDFGIARSSAPDALDHRVVGTPAYMAPEQARGEPDLDARADVFSLGVVVYELLTGALPFVPEGTTAVSQIVSRATLDDPPPPPSTRAKSPLPSAVDAVLLGALAPRREARTPSALDFAAQLTRAVQSAA